MSAGRVCKKLVETATPGESITVAARRMQSRNVGSLVVVDEFLVPIGFLTDRDLVLRVLAPSIDTFDCTVRDVMTRDPQVVTVDAPLEDVLRVMRLGPYRRLPVVDEQHSLVGLISLDDILKVFSEEFVSIGSLLSKEGVGNLNQSLTAE